MDPPALASAFHIDAIELRPQRGNLDNLAVSPRFIRYCVDSPATLISRVPDGSSSRGQIGEVGLAAILGSGSARRARSTNNEKVWHLRETVYLIRQLLLLSTCYQRFGSNLPFNNFNCCTSLVSVSC